MKNPVPSVTIAVCTYNEAQNIEMFIKTALEQVEKGFTINEILVVDDGSTDGTAQVVRKLKLPEVRLIAHPNRTGKSYHLNQIYNDLTADILVQSDGDITFDNPYVVYHLIRPLLTNDSIMMTGGNPLPALPKSFFEKCLVHTLEPYFSMRKKLRNGVNPYTAIGQLLAYKNAFLKKIFIPHDMIANDNFTYYSCLNHGYKYAFTPKAIVRFRTAQTIMDHVRQNTRFSAVPTRMKRYFPADFINHQTQIPHTYISLWIKAAFTHSLSFLLLGIINGYCRIAAAFKEPFLNAKWDMAITTKKL